MGRNDKLVICEHCFNKYINKLCEDYFFCSSIEGLYVTTCPPDNMICERCGHKLITTSITHDDFAVIIEISKDKHFILAMIKLKDENIIEYESRMSQFRSQLVMREGQGGTGRVLCPYCKSSDVEKISMSSRAVSIGLLDITSEMIGKQWLCNQCGSYF